MDPYKIRTTQQPATIGLQLSPTCIPNLNRATDMLRLAYPKASDGELLERIFVGGICTVIDQFSTLSASSACRTSAAETPWT